MMLSQKLDREIYTSTSKEQDISTFTMHSKRLHWYWYYYVCFNSHIPIISRVWNLARFMTSPITSTTHSKWRPRQQNPLWCMGARDLAGPCKECGTEQVFYAYHYHKPQQPITHGPESRFDTSLIRETQTLLQQQGVYQEQKRAIGHWDSCMVSISTYSGYWKGTIYTLFYGSSTCFVYYDPQHTILIQHQVLSSESEMITPSTNISVPVSTFPSSISS